MADTPAWKMLGSTYGNRAGELLAELATHTAGMQAALDELYQLLDLPPNHALTSRQLVMLIKDEALVSLPAMEPPPKTPLPATVAGAQAQEVLDWIRARCTVLAGTVGGSTAVQLHTAYLEDDGLLGLVQFNRGLKAIGEPLRLSEVWGSRTRGEGRGTVRRSWNLAPLPKAPWIPPETPPKPPKQAPDWIDGGKWPGR